MPTSGPMFLSKGTGYPDSLVWHVTIWWGWGGVLLLPTRITWTRKATISIRKKIRGILVTDFKYFWEQVTCKLNFGLGNFLGSKVVSRHILSLFPGWLESLTVSLYPGDYSTSTERFCQVFDPKLGRSLSLQVPPTVRGPVRRVVSLVSILYFQAKKMRKTEKRNQELFSESSCAKRSSSEVVIVSTRMPSPAAP